MTTTEVDEEIAIMQKLVKDSGVLSKNKNFTPSHREALSTENRIFKRILKRLESAR